jgi:hypothetical protein
MDREGKMVQLMRRGRARRAATAARWTARVVATVLLVVYLRQDGNALQRLMGDQPLADDLYSIGFLIMLLGLAAGWLRAELGGALIVLGLVWAGLSRGLGMVSGDMGDHEIARSVLAMLPFLVAGAFYLVSHGVARRGDVSRMVPAN